MANPRPLALIPGRVNRSHVPQLRPSADKQTNIKKKKRERERAGELEIN